MSDIERAALGFERDVVNYRMFLKIYIDVFVA